MRAPLGRGGMTGQNVPQPVVWVLATGECPNEHFGCAPRRIISVARTNLTCMKNPRCRTTRAAIPSHVEAVSIAAKVRKGAEAVHCPYCGWWHVVGIGSSLERPSKPRK